VAVLENILGENDRIADLNRADLAAAGVTTVNLMSSPGAGKTQLLKRTIAELGPRLRLGIVEGDIATSLDADEPGAIATGAAVDGQSLGVAPLEIAHQNGLGHQRSPSRMRSIFSGVRLSS
jgi:hypothetical protein